tara:strand:+ start:5984 stop:7066 length:1083 start_codon:yes stop_codon:yes gene_type:complete
VHSSTSNSEPTVYLRLLPRFSFWRRIVTFTAVLTLTALGSVERYARANEYPILFQTNPALWATQWLTLDDSPNDQTVIIGASRCIFRLNLGTWEQETDTRPIILAWSGSLPHPTLNLLTQRKGFRGLVVCGIAPSFSFSHPSEPQHEYLQKNIEAMHILRYSLSYHIGTPVKRFLKHRFRCLNQIALGAIHTLLEKMVFADRDGLQATFLSIPWMNHQENLQSKYLDSAAENEEFMKRVTALWQRIIDQRVIHGAADVDSLLESYKANVQRINDRGGQVVFIRHPGSGDFLTFETEHYPRDRFFDRLCKETGYFGIHFKDYPEFANLQCPEWSHLTPQDANNYTRKLIELLKQKQLVSTQ